MYGLYKRELSNKPHMLFHQPLPKSLENLLSAMFY